jgi:colanic acid biosynthesis glycosyl transferase WcaI
LVSLANVNNVNGQDSIRLHVLIIAQYFPPDMGGGATRAYNMAKGLSLCGCEVTVVAAFPHYPTGRISKEYRRKFVCIAPEQDKKIRIIRTFVPPLASKGFSNRLILFSSFVLSSLAAVPFTRRINAIWASNPNVIAVFPSLIYGVLKNCPVFQNVDDLWPEALYDLGANEGSSLAKLGEVMAKFTYTMSDGVTPISPGYVHTLESKYAVSKNKIAVIPAGADLDHFKYLSSKKENKRFRVLYIGAFSPAYDFKQIIEAAKLLPEVEFVIQGGGELANGLRVQINESGVLNVKLVEKIVSRQEVAQIMSEADALILPLNGVGSIEMGISSKLYEYQAAGKPIICCSNGQPGRYVADTKSGIVVKPGDFKKLADTIRYLTAHADVAKSLGNSGKKYVYDNLSIKQIGARMKGFLESRINDQ